MTTLKALLGLFIPVRYKNSTKKEFTIAIGVIPLGWIMVLIAIIF